MGLETSVLDVHLVFHWRAQEDEKSFAQSPIASKRLGRILTQILTQILWLGGSLAIPERVSGLSAITQLR